MDVVLWVKMKNLCVEMLAVEDLEYLLLCGSGDVCDDDTIGHTMARITLRASSWTQPMRTIFRIIFIPTVVSRKTPEAARFDF